ncbi:uncharacterized protein LOC127867220 [Dreissena polymorpha]|uniref:Uncharacterized protein n=1 Tax=Dreissena polymorpha TaxID=45954 RepID=A0A9D4LY96_DREPO|nr:uncharacterized protein LOC127867220 [Dreissena polymorpha]KAH3866211.1 hypothetical protein DPMN_029269 [Dreissena polymorpha]
MGASSPLLKIVLSLYLASLFAAAFTSDERIIKVSIESEVEDGRNVTIRCNFNGSLTFDVINSSNEITPIGGCDGFGKSFVNTAFLRDKYDIKAVPGGGTLTIINLDQSRYGKYNCKDAFNATSADSVIVSPEAKVKNNQGYAYTSLPFEMLIICILRAL